MLDEDVRAVILEARGSIADPKRWCQFVGARRANGEPTALDDPLAVQMCAGAAVTVAGGEVLGQEASKVLDRFVQAKYEGQTWHSMYGHQQIPRSFLRLWHVNDHVGHAEVLEIFDLALGAT